MSIDDLVEELRAAVPDNPPELARLEEALCILQTSAEPELIRDRDDIVRIIVSPRPLVHRISMVCAMLQARLRDHA